MTQTDFQRIADRRLPNAQKAIQLIGNLSTYKHEKVDAEQMVAALEEEIQKVRERFKLPTRTDIQPEAVEPTTREPVAQVNAPVVASTVARRFFESKAAVSVELSKVAVNLKSASFLRAVAELEPDCGWVIVVYATRELPKAVEYGYEVRVVSS